MTSKEEQDEDKQGRREEIISELDIVLKGKLGMVPSKKQVGRLRKAHTRWNQFSLDEWFTLLIDEEYASNPPFEHCRPAVLWKLPGYCKEGISRDQFIRADRIVECATTQAKNKFVLLDGHGRLVFELLYCLFCREENMNDYSVTVYETDKTAHDWQQSFIPGVHKYDSIFNYKVESHAVVYLNFSALDGQYTELLAFLNKWRGATIFVTFSVRGGRISISPKKLEAKEDAPKYKQDGTMSMAGMVHKLNRHHKYSVVSSRGFMVTIEMI